MKFIAHVYNYKMIMPYDPFNSFSFTTIKRTDP